MEIKMTTFAAPLAFCLGALCGPLLGYVLFLATNTCQAFVAGSCVDAPAFAASRTVLLSPITGATFAAAAMLLRRRWARSTGGA